MTDEQPINLTAKEIIEQPISGLKGRTPRDQIEMPRAKKGKKEVRLIVDASGSNQEPAGPGSPMTKQQLIIATLPHFVRILEVDDAQAAREQAGGSSKKGGCRTFYANEPEPIEFDEGEDESDDPRDGKDLNSANIGERLAEIPWGGRTFLMPAFNAADHASSVEYASLPAEQRWDALVTMLITDGKVSDQRALEARLDKAGPRDVMCVTVIGYGDGHDEAVEHYQALAEANPYLTVVALTGVSNPEEAALDLRLLSGTAASS